MAWSGELQVGEPREAGKPKRANEGDKNCWSNIPKEQKEAFPRALNIREVILSFFLFFFPQRFYFFPFSPQSTLVHRCIFFVVGPSSVVCGMPPQHSLTSSALSAPRIQTSETLGH